MSWSEKGSQPLSADQAMVLMVCSTCMLLLPVFTVGSFLGSSRDGCSCTAGISGDLTRPRGVTSSRDRPAGRRHLLTLLGVLTPFWL